MGTDDCGAKLADMQRQLCADESAYRRATERQKMRESMLRVGWSLYHGAMLGPMYAAFNPDPRALPLALEQASTMQAAALQFIADHC